MPRWSVGNRRTVASRVRAAAREDSALPTPERTLAVSNKRRRRSERRVVADAARRLVPSASAGESLGAIRAVVEEVLALERGLPDLVVAARRSGAGWHAIGGALLMNPGSAWRRYHALVEAAGPA